MSRMWQELPPELLDNVLHRLPVHVLCRCRLVCKRWKDVITHPGFASGHAQTLQQPYVLVSPRVLKFDPGTMQPCMPMPKWCMTVPDSVLKMATRRDWKIMDMAEKRFFTLNDFPIKDYLQRGLKEPWSYGWSKYTLASDGGLVYALYAGYRVVAGRRHIVYNPMGKNWHEIPEPYLCCRYNHDIVVMSVDKATQNYKIVIMEGENLARSKKVWLYNSTATQWRMLCEVPAKHQASSSIFLKGVFYTLFVDTFMVPWWPKLYSCDLESGAWRYIDVELPRPSHLQDKFQLVVSLDRLFLVEYTGVPIFHRCGGVTAWETLVDYNSVVKRHKQLIKVTILEIRLAAKDVIMVAQVPKYAKYPRRMLDRPELIIGNPVVAVGCGDSIVISSLLRRRLRFDLMRYYWKELPEDTGCMYETNRQARYKYQGIYVGILDPDLREMGELRLGRIDIDCEEMSD